MSLESFISGKLISGSSKSFSKPVINLSITGVALGLCLMILSVAIILGFKTEIKSKVSGFGSHIVIKNISNTHSLESAPITSNDSLINSIGEHYDVKGVYPFAIKAGILKAGENTQGIALKGVDENYDWSFFENNMISGAIPAISDTSISKEVLVSKTMANMLDLNLGDKVIMYFIQAPERPRAFHVCGIFQTGLDEEIDKKFIIGDIQQIRRLNHWNDNQADGLEIIIDQVDDAPELAYLIDSKIGYEMRATPVQELYPDIFNWLAILDVNVYIILVLMIIVAAINMISALLIMVLERVKMIGVLKSLGTTTKSIRKIFLYYAAYIIARGLIIGNILAFLIGFLQIRFGIIKLDPQSYHLSEVPFNFTLSSIVALNLGTLFICLIILILPSYAASRVEPSKAIRFD